MPDSLTVSIDQQRTAIAACTRMFTDLKIMDHSGHVTIRLPDNSGFLIQSINASRSQLLPGDIFAVGFDGEIIDGPSGTRPAGEYPIHSEIYKVRPDVNAVLHAHPKVPILFTIAEGAKLIPVTNHAYRWRNGIPVHGDTGHIDTADLGRAMVETMGEANAVLLRAHGIVLASENIQSLLIDGIHFDRNAQAQFDASRLGTPIPMSESEFDIFESRFDRANHGIKLWHHYASTAIEAGVMPEDWRDVV
ncbi:MAG: class II aldolase/adducin family protein [Rhodospirillaceae bacterium]|jgi:L-ribulose-5-phosphate 4-epimerase|nr:class II aldolase/adducin family protein [Rhodospirillaceae bacterium]MBT5456925.1 class II aldolase/adducin family protein [Rhodospirillaceae bacterium]